MSTPIYNRQRKESAKAFEAFQLYRDLGPERSLAKVGQRLGKSKTMMERWSTQWNWVARVTAWDAEQDRLAREAQQKEVVEMNKRHAQIAGVLQTKALERLTTMPPSELKPHILLDFLVKAAEIERKARGQPSEIVEQRNKELMGDEDRSLLSECLQNDGFRNWLADVSSDAGGPPATSANGHVPSANGQAPPPAPMPESP